MFQRKIQEIDPPRVLPFPKLKLTTVRNTIVTCTNCFGNGWNFVKRMNGTFYRRKCVSCHHGQTYISNEGLSHR